MVRHYSSFLVRCWHLASGERRVRVEHVQTGEVLHATTLEDAFAWMDARVGADTPDLLPGWVSPVSDSSDGSRQPPPKK